MVSLNPSNGLKDLLVLSSTLDTLVLVHQFSLRVGSILYKTYFGVRTVSTVNHGHYNSEEGLDGDLLER